MQRKSIDTTNNTSSYFRITAVVAILSALFGCVTTGTEITQSSDRPYSVNGFSKNCSSKENLPGSKIRTINGYELFRSPKSVNGTYQYSIRSPHTECVISINYPSKDGVRAQSFFVDDHGVSLTTETVTLEYFEYLREACAAEKVGDLTSCDAGILTAAESNGVHLVFEVPDNDSDRPSILTVLPIGAFSEGKKL